MNNVISLDRFRQAKAKEQKKHAVKLFYKANSLGTLVLKGKQGKEVFILAGPFDNLEKLQYHVKENFTSSQFNTEKIFKGA